MTLLPLYLFPEIRWWQILLSKEDVKIEVCENWVKQSGRSRYEISGPNGRQLLVVPTEKSSRKRLRDVKIDLESSWAMQHWRAMQTAYNNTPFFTHYKDEVQDLLFSGEANLSEKSKRSLQWLSTKLGVDRELIYTESYVRSVETDYRYTELSVENEVQYPQVFEERLGFLANLSVLDLLFHMGPESLFYLLSATAPSE